MRYDNRELIDILSAEYVLGILKGAARRRFEQLSLNRPLVSESLHWWEKQLNVLIETLPETKPNKNVWKRINNQLFDKTPYQTAWLGLTKIISTALIASIATFLVMQSPKQTQIDEYQAVATLTNSSIKSGWHLGLVLAKDGSAKIKAYSLYELVQKQDASYELWLLPEKSGKPISLGLLPQQGNQEYLMRSNLIQKLKNGQLAVSIEPIGGSPTGQPTGDVVYQGAFINIKKGLNS